MTRLNSGPDAGRGGQCVVPGAGAVRLAQPVHVEVDRAIALSLKLEIENERLQVEKRAQATPLRVEKLAKEQLQMRTSTPAITQYVTVEATGAKAP